MFKFSQFFEFEKLCIFVTGKQGSLFAPQSKDNSHAPTQGSSSKPVKQVFDALSLEAEQILLDYRAELDLGRITGR